MPVTSEEVLRDLIAATKDARDVIREAHETQKSLRTAMKENKDRITKTIVDEVTAQIGELSESVQAEMREKVSGVIDGIAAEWRERLGLTA